MNELKVEYTTQFKRDYKRALRRNLDVSMLNNVILKLAHRETLPSKNRDHALHNNWEGFRECHIQPDWLLVYQVIEKKLVLSLVRTGTHADFDF